MDGSRAEEQPPSPKPAKNKEKGRPAASDQPDDRPASNQPNKNGIPGRGRSDITTQKGRNGGNGSGRRGRGRGGGSTGTPWNDDTGLSSPDPPMYIKLGESPERYEQRPRPMRVAQFDPVIWAKKDTKKDTGEQIPLVIKQTNSWMMTKFIEWIVPDSSLFIELEFRGDATSPEHLKSYAEFFKIPIKRKEGDSASIPANGFPYESIRFPPKCRIFNPYCLFAITKKQMESTKGCILIRAADRNDKLKALGLHGPKLSLAKRAKYAGLLFNNYRPIFELENVRIEKVDDVKVNGYNFTDGSGLVSMDVAEEMIRGHAVHSADHEYREHRPSIFQVRLPGVKGVLVADPTLPNRTIRLRPSMIKLDVLSLLQFDTEAQMYKRMPCHVVGFARPAKAYTTINHQVLALLVQRGVKVDSILKLEKHYFDSVRYMTLSPAYALNYLWLTGKFSLLEALIKDIVSLSVIASERAVQKIWNRIATWQKSELADWRKPDRAPTPSQRAAEFQAQQSSSQDTANLLQTQSSVLIPPDPFAEDSKLMYRVRLPVRGVSVYGCADHTGQLKPGECYLQVTWAGVDKPTVLSGKVMVFRFPSYHPNDIRILTAVEKPPSGLENVADVIVFPTNGTRPHPDEMSGGDLDGDKFSVIWDDMLFPDDGPGCEPFHYDAGKMAALVVSAISARVPQEPLPYQNLSKPKKTAAHFHEELVDFLTTLPNHYAVVQVDSVMRLWQRLSHPAAPAQIQDVLVSMFNVGIDHTAPSDGRGKSILNPENVKALLNVLTSKIGKHAVGPSEVSDLDEKLMTEINDCVHSTQKRKHSLLQPIFKLNVDSAMEDIIALYAKSNRGDFQSPASSDLLVWTREKLMVAPTLRIVYEDFPITVELQDEVDLARHALRAAGSKIVEIEQSALGASGWMPVELASQISETFGSDRAKRCVELLQALEGDLKKLASNNSLILQLVSTWATLAEPVDLAEQNLRRAKKDKDREDKDREDDAELIVRLGEELNAARAKFKDWINNSTRDYLRERGKESDKNTRIEMQARLIAKVNGIVEKVRVYTGRGSDFVSELHKITSAFITRVQCFGSAERHLRDLSGLVDIECHLMGKGYFPVYDRRAEIHRAIDFLDDKDESQRARRILLLVAQTGSGKSTIAPQFIVNARILAGQASFRRRVVVAQPRRVAATSVAQHVAGIRNTTLGAEVGYHIGRMGRAVVKQGETLLEFVTYGILLARSASDPSFTSFSVVVVDEVHEAGMELYLLLGSLRRALDSNASLRVVLMSAAVDEKKLIDFFGNDVDRGRLKDDMDLFEDKDLQKAKLDDIIRNAALPVTEPKNENKPNTGQSSVPESRNRQTTDLGAVALVRVTTATYPVEVYYGIKSDSNYVEVCVEKCIEIHIANHDILKRTREILLEDPNTTAVSMNKQSKSSKKNKKKKKGKKTESDKEVSEERGTIQAEVAVKDDADASKPGSSKVPVPDVDDDDEAMTPEKEERMLALHQDILVFFPRTLDITTACDMLRSKAKKKGLRDIVALPLYASLDDDEKDLVLNPQYAFGIVDSEKADNENAEGWAEFDFTEKLNKFQAGVRRVIFATNVAETSLTISSLGYVVDSGLHLHVTREIRTGAVTQTVARIPKTSAIQRKGRVGRKFRGICYRMYSQEEYNMMDEGRVVAYDQLDSAVLRMLKADIDPLTFTWFLPPQREDIEFAIQLLLDLKFITKVEAPPTPDNVDDEKTMDPQAVEAFIGSKRTPYVVTHFGDLALQFASAGLHCQDTRFLIEAAELNCFEEAVTIVAFHISRFNVRLPDNKDESPLDQPAATNKGDSDSEDESDDELDDDNAKLLLMAEYFSETSIDADENLEWSDGRAFEALLWYYGSWLREVGARKRWCKENGVRHDQLKQVHRVRVEIRQMAIKLGWTMLEVVAKKPKIPEKPKLMLEDLIKMKKETKTLARGNDGAGADRSDYPESVPPTIEATSLINALPSPVIESKLNEMLNAAISIEPDTLRSPARPVKIPTKSLDPMLGELARPSNHSFSEGRLIRLEMAGGSNGEETPNDAGGSDGQEWATPSDGLLDQDLSIESRGVDNDDDQALDQSRAMIRAEELEEIEFPNIQSTKLPDGEDYIKMPGVSTQEMDQGIKQQQEEWANYIAMCQELCEEREQNRKQLRVKLSCCVAVSYFTHLCYNPRSQSTRMGERTSVSLLAVPNEEAMVDRNEEATYKINRILLYKRSLEADSTKGARRVCYYYLDITRISAVNRLCVGGLERFQADEPEVWNRLPENYRRKFEAPLAPRAVIDHDDL